jgi:hypothetical protein
MRGDDGRLDVLGSDLSQLAESEKNGSLRIARRRFKLLVAIFWSLRTHETANGRNLRGREAPKTVVFWHSLNDGAPSESTACAEKVAPPTL